MTNVRVRPLQCIGLVAVCVVLPGCSGCVQRAVPGPAVEHAAFAARYLQEGDYELAEQRADLSVEYSGGTYAEPWNIKALIEIQRGHLQVAREDVKRALSLRSDFAEAYNTLGTIEQVEHDDSHAIDAFAQAITLDPGYLAARRNRGLAYMRAHEGKASRGDFLKCLEVDPTYCDCREGLGALAMSEKDWSEARGQLEKLTQICPNRSSGFYNLCVTEMEQQDCEGALDSCVHALSLERNCAECEHNLSEAYACIAKRRGPGGQFAQLVQANRTDPDVHYQLGAIFEEQHLLQEAADEYRGAVLLSSGKHTAALYRLARVDDNLGLSRGVVEACQLLLDTVRGDELRDERAWCAGRVRELQLR